MDAEPKMRGLDEARKLIQLSRSKTGELSTEMAKTRSLQWWVELVGGEGPTQAPLMTRPAQVQPKLLITVVPQLNPSIILKELTPVHAMSFTMQLYQYLPFTMLESTSTMSMMRLFAPKGMLVTSMGGETERQFLGRKEPSLKALLVTFIWLRAIPHNTKCIQFQYLF